MKEVAVQAATENIDTTEGGFADRDRYLEARRTVTDAAAAYYRSELMMMDDATYDALHAAVAATEAAHPDWVDGVPVTAVAAGTGGGGDVVHARPMLSLDNVFDRAALEEFVTRADTAAGAAAGWLVEPKLDGLAAAATYRHGRLVLLATRGDGTTGEDITGCHADIDGLPAQLTEPVDVEVRGELHMTDVQFAAANTIRAGAGAAPFANPRNGTAGAVLARHGRYRLPVSFRAYASPTFDDDGHVAAMARLAALGVATAAALDGVDAAPTGADGVWERVERLAAARATLGYAIDGAVVKAADADVKAKLGVSSRAPRWAVAYKYPPDTRLTTITGITVTVGRTGVVTPVAELAPVTVGGATVTAATCSNPSEVVRKDLRVGDRVWVRRAGDVIPEIVSVHLPDRPAGTSAWVPPTGCPRCDGPLDRSGRRWRCTNRTCGTVEQVTYFASRDAMDIDGCGPGVVAALAAAGLVSDPADLYTLTVETVAALDGFGEVSAANLVAAIDGSKRQPLHRLVTGLGIRTTGRSLSRRIVARFPTLDALAAATVDELAAVDGVGPVKAAVIVDEVAELAGLIGRLTAAGVGTTAPATAGAAGAAGPLAGRKVVVTGTVPGLTRTEASELVERLGGVASGSVSKATDLVVVGDGAGAKAAKAAALGIATITADDLLALAAG